MGLLKCLFGEREPEFFIEKVGEPYEVDKIVPIDRDCMGRPYCECRVCGNKNSIKAKHIGQKYKKIPNRVVFGSDIQHEEIFERFKLKEDSEYWCEKCKAGSRFLGKIATIYEFVSGGVSG